MFSKLVGFFKQATNSISVNNSQTGSQNILTLNKKEIKNIDDNINKENQDNNNLYRLNIKTINNQFDYSSPIYLNPCK